jgi:DNA repair protein RAD57
MTNLLTVLPDFDIKPYTHILPSLEKALISTADLLSLDALDVAKRAQVPAGEVRKLADGVLVGLYSGLGVSKYQYRNEIQNDRIPRESDGADPAVTAHSNISTLDDTLDVRLAGGIKPGYLTEIVGER